MGAADIVNAANPNILIFLSGLATTQSCRSSPTRWISDLAKSSSWRTCNTATSSCSSYTTTKTPPPPARPLSPGSGMQDSNPRATKLSIASRWYLLSLGLHKRIKAITGCSDVPEETDAAVEDGVDGVGYCCELLYDGRGGTQEELRAAESWVE